MTVPLVFFAQIYSPSRRLRLHGLPALAMEAAKTIEGYAKVVLPMIPRDIEDMAPGEGFVGQKGLCKVGSSSHLFPLFLYPPCQPSSSSSCSPSCSFRRLPLFCLPLPSLAPFPFPHPLWSSSCACFYSFFWGASSSE